MSPIIYTINNAVFRENMASFDYDWTTVNPKNGKTFPSDITPFSLKNGTLI